MCDSFKFLCPDWRGPSMVIDAASFGILHANASCREILKSKRPFGERNGYLAFNSSCSKRNLQSGIIAARKSQTSSAAVTYVLADEVFAVSAMIRVLPGLEFQDDSETLQDNPLLSDTILVELSDCNYNPDPVGLKSLSEAFKLSPLETRDLAQIAMGVPVRDIAEKGGVAVSTVRQRIKSMLSKTGFVRQQELICLVRSLCPASYARHQHRESTPQMKPIHVEPSYLTAFAKAESTDVRSYSAKIY